MKEGGIYVHVPYCRNKCLYCDFYSGGERIADWDNFNKAVINELKSRFGEITFRPTTLYLGGGTPSLMPSDNFKGIIADINSSLNIEAWKEFTIEVNPEDVNESKCKIWKDSGVNRISLGIQSLNDSELKVIGRKHTAQDAVRAFHLMQNYFENISVDLMFGIPDQTIDSFTTTLDRIIELSPNHISAYSLMLEPGTAMTLLVNKYGLKLPKEDEWLQMFQIANSKLKESGYLRYETSNYALTGYESKHNKSYWMGLPYLGLGPGAHSYNGDRIRRSNPNDIKGFINNYILNPTVFYKEENLSEEELKEEMIMTRLRMAKGLDLKEFNLAFGEKEKNNLLHRASPFIKQNLMKEKEGSLSFTYKGFLISDSILSKLI